MLSLRLISRGPPLQRRVTEHRLLRPARHRRWFTCRAAVATAAATTAAEPMARVAGVTVVAVEAAMVLVVAVTPAVLPAQVAAAMATGATAMGTTADRPSNQGTVASVPRFGR
jgi:hypothetical protein